MKAAIICVGYELLAGDSTNTNGIWLAERLGNLGIETILEMTVGDNRGEIADALKYAAQRAQLIMITGGLGPTGDDLTRRGLAEALGTVLATDENCLGDIEEFFRRRGREMAEINRSQALIPAGAEPLKNDIGTAPGIATHLGDAQIFVMPGVPDEMKHMFNHKVAGRIKACVRSTACVRRYVHAFGAGESDIAARIADMMTHDAPVAIGTKVSSGWITIRVVARNENADLARRDAQRAVEQICGRLGELVVGLDEQTMAGVVGRLLREKRRTLAVAESCTGGLLGGLITDVPGASDYYLGGVVAYDNRIKQQQLGVPADVLEKHGAVSEQVAGAMAQGVRKRFESDWGIGVTGVAGPAGGTPPHRAVTVRDTAEKPVGLVYVALAGADGCDVHRHVFSGSRQIIRRRAALTGLNHLRVALLS